ncbi:MAG: CAP domain-containing protein [Chloroflexota bacterium]
MSLQKKDPYEIGDVVLLERSAEVVRGRIQGWNSYIGEKAEYRVFYGRGKTALEMGVIAKRIFELAPPLEKYGPEDLVLVHQKDESWKAARVSGVRGAPNLYYEYTVSNLDGSRINYQVYDDSIVVANETDLEKYTPSKNLAKTLSDLIIAEVNEVRRGPANYAKRLEGLEKLDGFFTVNAAKREVAIDFLSQLESRGVLAKAVGLGKAALDFASDTGTINGPNHLGSDGSTAFDRMARYGTGGKGECLSSSKISAFAFIAGFLMSPGHRDILVDAETTHIGVACAYHQNGNYIRCVINTGMNWQPKAG